MRKQVLGNIANPPSPKWLFLKPWPSNNYFYCYYTEPTFNSKKVREPRISPTSYVPNNMGMVIPTGKQNKTKMIDMSSGIPILVGVSLKTILHLPSREWSAIFYSSFTIQGHNPPTYGTILHTVPQTH